MATCYNRHFFEKMIIQAFSPHLLLLLLQLLPFIDFIVKKCKKKIDPLKTTTTYMKYPY